MMSWQPIETPSRRHRRVGQGPASTGDDAEHWLVIALRDETSFIRHMLEQHPDPVKRDDLAHEMWAALFDVFSDFQPRWCASTWQPLPPPPEA